MMQIRLDKKKLKALDNKNKNLKQERGRNFFGSVNNINVQERTKRKRY